MGLRAAPHAETSLAVETTSDHVVIASGDFTRIAGEKSIVRDDVDQVQMMRNGWSRSAPAIEVLHSSGLSAYDAKIPHTVRDEWRDMPYRDNGANVRVCTVVHFVYRQR